MTTKLRGALVGLSCLTVGEARAWAQDPAPYTMPTPAAAPTDAPAAPPSAPPSAPPAENPCVLTNAAGACVQWAVSPPATPHDAAPAPPPAPVPPSDLAPPPPEGAPATATGESEPAPSAEAEGPTPGIVPGETDHSGDRTLTGHTFQVPRLIDNAFITASFYVGSSVELYHQAGVTARVPTTKGTTDTITFDRDITFVKLNYGADFRASEYFSFGLDADYLAEVGTNGETLFTWGGSGGFDLRPNVKVRLVRGDESGSQLAVRAHGSFQGGIRAMPLGLLIDISNQIQAASQDPTVLANCLIQANFTCLGTPDVGSDITAQRKRYGGGAALAFAQSLGRYAGVQLAAGVEGASTNISLPLGGGQTSGIASSETVLYAGIAPSLNFYPMLPVGMTYEYRFELDKATYDANASVGLADATKVSATSHRMNWGLYYTGRRDLMLGWLAGVSYLQDLVRSMQNAGSDPRAFVFAAQFDMRYFF